MNKQILRLAIPNIISNISVPLIGVVDTALMGHLGSEKYLGAIALGGVIFNFIYLGFIFLRMGTTGITAQAFGRKDLPGVIHTFTRSLGLALLIGLWLIALQTAIIWAALFFIDAGEEILHLAQSYFFIRIYAAPATLALYALNGWFLGMQNARYPMAVAIVSNILNVVLSAFFVMHWNMDSNGVALGTVVGQYSGFLLAAGLFLLSYRKLLSAIDWRAVLQLKTIRSFFRINADIFLRTIFLIFTFSFFTIKSAELGNAVLASNQVLMQLLGLISYGIDGFAFAAESLVGKYTGRGDRAGLKKAIRYSFCWGLTIASFFSLTYGFFDDWILKIFTDQESILKTAKPYLAWIILAPLVNSICYIWDGIFIGATASKEMRNSMFFATFLIFLPAYIIFTPIWGNHGLWLAMTLFMLGRGVLLTIYSRTI